IWTSISIDRCRHGDDEKADILQIFGARRQTQAGLAEFVLRNFPRTIDALAKFLNAGFRDIKPIDAVELSRERKSHRKSDIAESDHSKCFFAQLRTSCTLPDLFGPDWVLGPGRNGGPRSRAVAR